MLRRNISMKHASSVLFMAATTQAMLLSSSFTSSSSMASQKAFVHSRMRDNRSFAHALPLIGQQRTAPTFIRGGTHMCCRAMSYSSANTDILQHQQTPDEIEMTQDALSITHAAIEAVDPFVAIQSHLSNSCTRTSNSSLDGTRTHSGKTLHILDRDSQSTFTYDLNSYDEVYIASIGKAASAMALATARIVSQAGNDGTDYGSDGNNISASISIRGKVITKDDHATAEQIEELSSQFNITVHFASHPIPDERSVMHSMSLLEDISQIQKRTLVINCISGGGSSVFCTPCPPLKLSHMSIFNQQLLASGMPITEMNVIRKKVEVGKGGGLVERIEGQGCDCLAMVLSDVIGDPLDLIASGPTVRDESTWADAWNLVQRYNLDEGGRYELPSEILSVLKAGMEKEELNVQHEEDTKTGGEGGNSSSFVNESRTVLVGNNALAVDAAASEALKLGYNPVVLGTTIEGEAIHIANMYISMAQQIALQRNNNSDDHEQTSTSLFRISQLPAALIAGGETVVTLPDDHGMGGRNQEIGLAAALQMKKLALRNVVVASVGTDGTDGPTDAAGAVVDGSTIDRIEHDNGFTCLGETSLQHHDAYTFLDSSDRHGSLIKTGATGTNVADVCAILIK